MPERHTALLIEDEPEIARELGDLLASLGHAHIHAADKAQAEEFLEREDYCFVLLDLHLKVNSDSILAHVEAGQTLLERIRSRHPRRGTNDQHLLQILPMSGHAKDRQFIVRSLQEGADDFIVKPISENVPPFREKIRDALTKSGRNSHTKCAAITRFARAAGADLTTMATAEATVRLALTGRWKHRRVEVQIDDKTVFVTAVVFRLLVGLAVGRICAKEGWVHKSDLGATTEDGWKDASRLKEELARCLPPNVQIFENDRNGSYRLNPLLALAPIDSAALMALGDARISKLAKQIAQKA
jgi:CheY-like chemotaxis protein